MDAGLALFLLLVGLSVGFLSGLLGIGGGIVMFPLLLYVPQLLGLGSIDVKSVTGLTMTQGFFAALAALFYYHQNALVNRPLVLALGLSLFLSSLMGALVSKRIPDGALLIVFGVLALIASAMMLVPRSHARDEMTEDTVTFNKGLAVAIGIVLGFTIGLVGQGGAFILIPVLLYVLKIPLRVALGSTLAIGLFSSSAGLVGKLATGQVPFQLAIPLLVGAIPAARWGSIMGKKTNTRFLRWLLAALILATAVKVWASLL
ncbi:MAG TPA: sulfite exporter TauE/SafE family protein [Nitrospirota bacterium]|nr:sulfite exporter TauE/SafE family protein [Nitrospirota bacterium]